MNKQITIPSWIWAVLVIIGLVWYFSYVRSERVKEAKEQCYKEVVSQVNYERIYLRQIQENAETLEEYEDCVARELQPVD